jgi:type IV pilus assembly protein PilY1
MKTTRLLAVLAALAAAATAALLLLPLRGQGVGECCNAATSLAATINAPVNGDEKFFELPNGPSNIMFLLDNSGSMGGLPQCGDSNFGSGGTVCAWPAAADLPKPGSGVVGSCTLTNTVAMQWMFLKDKAGVLLKSTDAPAQFDPGKGATANIDGLVDNPTWGSACTGNNCLFQKGKIYKADGWSETSATAYAACDSSGVTSGLAASLTGTELAKCTACLANQGFFFLQDKDGKRAALFDGWWLNLNPPKFMTARKVIKNTVWMDSTDPLISKNLDAARFGLAVLNSGGSPITGATLVVPLGPDKPHAFDATGTNGAANRAATAAVRQKIIDAMNKRDKTGAAVAAAPKLIDGSTPLAAGLLALGNYFSGAMASGPLVETAAGTMGASWAGTGSPQCTICWSCQTSAILLVTDGAPNTESPMPATYNGSPATWTSYDEATYVANCGTKAAGYPRCKSTSGGTVTLTPRVASWLNGVDKRLALTTPILNQVVQVSTIGYGILTAFGATSTTWNILTATANMGGGKAYDATTPAELATQIAAAVNDVIGRANSFSAPAASSLSTIHTAASEVFITRFTPNDTAYWQGHVYQWLLFDEFLNGCDSTKTPTGQAQINCRGKSVYPNYNGSVGANGLSTCSDVFMVDSSCDEVVENVKTGAFEKKGSGGTTATPIWDAGEVLSCANTDCLAKTGAARDGYKTAVTGQSNSRTIWTWLNGAKVSVEPSAVATLQPFMNMTKDWCYANLPRTKLCGGTSGVACPASVAAVTAAQLTTCTTAVINFVRGYDVFDADLDNCAGPGVPNSGCPTVGGVKQDGEQREPANWSLSTANQFWKLSDVFHSSPVLLKPPVSEPVCDTGYDNQCKSTLRSPKEFDGKATQTIPDTYVVKDCTAAAKDMTVDAYGKYWYDNRKRQRILIVGANDGMLHAFDAGTVATGAVPNAQTCEYTYGPGNGAELWAFVPPDLLPRLKDMLTGHQYMVDGSAMVQDIWVDGLVGAADGKKQSGEFRSIAIVTERSGGTQLHALDVTTPSNPTLRWSFPPPCSDDQRYMAQSWSDFAPKAPPIGPVKIKTGVGAAKPDADRGFEEKWIVMLNGGYDPAMSQGAAVWMVDAWTGRVYWRYTNDTFKSQLGFGVGTSMFPVPGGVQLADVGDTDKSVFDNDGFFDLAAWGDMGGNLFVARFSDPGELDPTSGLVTNWFAARAFEEQRRADNLQYAAGRSEFFYMPDLTYDPASRAVHAYLGSGNRERMMQQGQACGPDNLMSCCKSGCSAVSSTTTDNYGSCSQVSGFSCTNGQLNNDLTSSTCGASATCASAGTFTSSVALNITCPAPTSGNVSLARTSTASCDAAGTCANVAGMGADDVVGKYTAACTKGRFYGIRAYGGATEKKFKTQAEAKTFDRARYTDVTYPSAECAGTGSKCGLIDTTKARAVVGSTLPDCTAAGGAQCYAKRGDPGWFYQYGDVCPTQSCPDFGTCSSEKTGSGSLVTFSCVLWNGFQPIGVQQAGIDPCSVDLGSPLTYGYASDYLSGVPRDGCGYTVPGATTLYRGQQRSSVSPPSAPLARITAGARGGVQYSGLQLDPGSAPQNTAAGTRSDFAESVYWLEVPRELHSCRHDAAGGNTICPGAR